MYVCVCMCRGDGVERAMRFNGLASRFLLLQCLHTVGMVLMRRTGVSWQDGRCRKMKKIASGHPRTG